MTRRPFATHVLIAAAAGVLTLVAATDVRADEVAPSWRWTVAPYVWAPGISGETSLPDRVPEATVDAGSILDALEFGALLRWGGTSERWRVLGDAAYLGLGKRSANDGAKTSFDVALVELAGAYRPNEHVDVLVGARYWGTNMEIDFDNPVVNDVDRERDWVDPFVGFRALAPMGESWDFAFRGDVGGFGVGSDLSWNAEMLFGWNATERFSLVFGYRHLALEDDWTGNGEEVDLEVAISGPEIGFAFRF